MQPRAVIVRRLIRWSLVTGCALLLWFAGYRGGRIAGIERGRQEGIADGQDQGFRDTLDFLGLANRNWLAIGVADRVFARAGSGVVQNPQALDAELQNLIDEICEEVAPGSWNLSEDRGNRIECEGMRLIVQGDPRILAEVDLYLKSKDEYLAWKRGRNAQP